MAGLGGMAQQSRDCGGLCRPEVHGLTEWIACRPVQAWGRGLAVGGAEIVLLWISSLAGLRGAGLQSGYCAGLFRTGGRQPSRMEIDHVCVWIASLAGLGGVAQQSRDHAGLCRPEGMVWRGS
jgi:hypothetical protein